MSKSGFQINIKEEKKQEVLFNPELYAEELSFESVNEKALKLIDESDIPIPGNFVEFVTGKKFLSTTILPRQIQIASALFGDICYYCSNKEVVNNLYDQKIDQIYNDIMFLRHGRCPKCKRTRLDMVENNQWTIPNALFVCAGQRCVIPSTYIHTDSGMQKIGKYLSAGGVCSSAGHHINGNLSSVWDGYNYTLPTSLYYATEEKTIKAETIFGSEIEGTEEHPLKINREGSDLFICMGDLYKTDKLIIQINQQSYGKEVAKFVAPIYAVIASSNYTMSWHHFELDYKGNARLEEVFNAYADSWDIPIVNREIDWSILGGLVVKEDELPDYLMSASKEDHRTFISVLMDAIGEPTSEGFFFPNIRYANQIRLILLNAGIYNIKVASNSLYIPAGLYCERLAEFYCLLRKFPEELFVPSDSIKIEYCVDYKEAVYEPINKITDGYSETMDITIPPHHTFTANAIMSHNSGKSILTGLVAQYQNARFLTMTNKKGERVIPYIYLKNPPSPLYGTFTAVTLDQAYKTLWEPFKGYLDSPWYKNYFEMLDYYGKKLGQELYKNSTTFLQFNHKRIGWLCEAPSKKSLRGKTRIFFSIDELSWHDLGTADDSNKGSAKEVMTAGRNSLLTMRKKGLDKFAKGNFNIPTGLETYVSSPAEANDILMRKVREAKHDKALLGYRYATWEFNPDYRSSDDIGESDPLVLWRDFGASPPLGDKQFYADGKSLVRMVGKRSGITEVTIEQFKNEFGEVTLYPSPSINFHYSSTHPKILTLDNGLTNNCFSGSLMHMEGTKAVTDLLVCIKPSKEAKINLAKCYDEFVLKLVKQSSLNIVLVAYDQWNSAQAIEDLKNRGVEALKYSPKYSEFLKVRDGYSAGSYEFLKPSVDPNILVDYDSDNDFVSLSEQDPRFGLLYQTLTVRDLGRMLAKPTFGDDDIFRSWALGVILMTSEDYKDKFSVEGSVTSKQRALGVLAKIGGGSSGSAVTSNLGGLARKRN